MRKDILLALLATSVTGTAYADANLGALLDKGNWTISGVIGEDGNTAGADVMVPDIAGGVATRTLSDLPQGKYKISWDNAVNAKVCVNGKEVKDGAIVELKAAGDLVVTVESADDAYTDTAAGFNGGYSLEGLKVTLVFKFEDVKTAIEKEKAWRQLGFSPMPDRADDSAAGKALKEAHKKLKAAVDAFKTMVEDDFNSNNIANLDAYKQYKLWDGNKEIIAALNDLAKSVDQMNKDTKTQNANWLIIKGKRDYVDANQKTIDGIKGAIKILADKGYDVAAATAAVDKAQADNDALKAKTEDPVKYTDAEKKQIADDIKAAQAAVDAINAAIDDAAAYPMVWGKDGLAESLADAVKNAKEDAFALLPLIQNVAVDRIDAYNNDALSILGKNQVEGSFNAWKNKDKIIEDINAIEGLVKHLLSECQPLVKNLDAVTATAGADYKNCRPSLIPGLQEDAQAVADDIVNLAADAPGHKSAYEVQGAIDTYELNVNKAINDKKLYEGDSTTGCKAINTVKARLQSQIVKYIADQDKKFPDEFKIGSRFEGGVNSIQTAINNIQAELDDVYYNTTDPLGKILGIVEKTASNIDSSIKSFHNDIQKISAAVTTLAKNQGEYQALWAPVNATIAAINVTEGNTVKDAKLKDLAEYGKNIDNMAKDLQAIPMSVVGQDLYEAVIAITYPNMKDTLKNALIDYQHAIEKGNRDALTKRIDADRDTIAKDENAADTDYDKIYNYLAGLDVTALVDFDTDLTLSWDVPKPAKDEKQMTLKEYLTKQINDKYKAVNDKNNKALANLEKQVKSADDAIKAVADNKALYAEYNKVLTGLPATITETKTWLAANKVISDKAKTETYDPFLAGLSADVVTQQAELDAAKSLKVKTAGDPSLLTTKGGLKATAAPITTIKTLAANVNGAQKAISNTEAWYKVLADKTIAVNDEAQGYQAILAADDPDDKTGLNAEIQGYVDQLLALNNDIYANYKSIFKGADGVVGSDKAYNEILSKIDKLQKSIEDAFANYDNLWKKANDDNLAASGWAKASTAMDQAFNAAAETYNGYTHLKNQGWADYLAGPIDPTDPNSKPRVDLVTYHENIYGEYQNILNTDKELNDKYQKAIKDHQVVSVEDYKAIVAKANNITKYLNSEEAKLIAEVNAAADAYYAQQYAAADAEIKAVESTLKSAQIVYTNKPNTTAEKLINTAYNEILETPQRNLALAAAAAKSAQAKNQLGKDLDGILENYLQSTVDGIKYDAQLKALWGNLESDYYADVTAGKTYQQFVSYEPENDNPAYDKYQSLAKQYDADVKALEALAEKYPTKADTLVWFNDAMSELAAVMDDITAIVNQAKKDQGDQATNDKLYGEWLKTLDKLNTDFDSLNEYVMALGAGYTQIVNVYNIHNNIESKAANNELYYENLRLTKGEINADLLFKAIVDEQYDAYNAEVVYLNKFVKNLYEAFNHAKVAAEKAGYVEPNTAEAMGEWWNKIKKLETELGKIKEVKAPEGDKKGDKLEKSVADFQAYETTISTWLVELAKIYQGDKFDTENPEATTLANLDAQYKALAAQLTPDAVYAAAGKVNGLKVETAVAEKYVEDIKDLQESLDEIKAAWAEDGVRVIATVNNYEVAMNDTRYGVKADLNELLNEIANYNALYVENATNYAALNKAYKSDVENTLKRAQMLYNTLNDVEAGYKQVEPWLKDWLDDEVKNVADMRAELESAKANLDFSGSGAYWNINYFNDFILRESVSLWDLQNIMIANEGSDLQWSTLSPAIKGAYNAYYSATDKKIRELVLPLLNRADEMESQLDWYWNRIYNPETESTTYYNYWSYPVASYPYTEEGVAAYAADSKVFIDFYKNLYPQVIEVINAYRAVEIAVNDLTYAKGDLNKDGVVDLFDSLLLRDIILSDDLKAGLTEVEKVLFDINNSGDITIADLTTLIYLINKVETEVDETAATAARIKGNNTMSLVKLGSEGGVTNFALNLTNSATMAGLQYDLMLSGDLEVVSENVADRASALTLFSKDNANGCHRVLLTSNDLSAAEGNSGAVVYFSVKGVGEISVVNAIGADIRGKEYAIEVGNNGLTGIGAIINDSDLENAEFYNVNGQRVDRIQKGVNIIRKADGTVIKAYNK